MTAVRLIVVSLQLLINIFCMFNLFLKIVDHFFSDKAPENWKKMLPIMNAFECFHV